MVIEEGLPDLIVGGKALPAPEGAAKKKQRRLK
jgi:hypothetical protein